MTDLAVKRVAERLVSAKWDDLTFRQLAIFLVIATEEGPHRVRAMAERFGVQKPIVTRATGKLVRYGWITRQRDRQDARDVLFTVTRAGATVLNVMRGWG